MVDSAATGATEDQEGTGPDAAPATGTATSTGVGHRADEIEIETGIGIGTEAATTGEGRGTARSPEVVSGDEIGTATVTGVKADDAGIATSSNP